MSRALRAELMKAPWRLLIGLLIAGPLLAAALGGEPSTAPGTSRWTGLYGVLVIRYAVLYYPLLAGIFAALVCRTEHVGGGWKQMLVLPVSRTSVYLAKYAMVAGLLLAANVVFVALYVGTGLAQHFPGPVPWDVFGRSLLGGWVAVLPLAALQLWASTRFKNFGAGLALNVCFTLPAIFAAQSHDIGPWYPWAQPVLAMVPSAAARGAMALTISSTTLWVVIVGGFVLAMAGGLLAFARSDIRV